MFKHEGVHQFDQDSLGRRSMIHFVVVSSDCVFGHSVKRGAELQLTTAGRGGSKKKPQKSSEKPWRQDVLVNCLVPQREEAVSCQH